MVGYWVPGNEPSGFINCREFLDWLRVVFSGELCYQQVLLSEG